MIWELVRNADIQARLDLGSESALKEDAQVTVVHFEKPYSHEHPSILDDSTRQ